MVDKAASKNCFEANSLVLLGSPRLLWYPKLTFAVQVQNSTEPHEGITR